MEKLRKVRIEWENGQQRVLKVWRYDAANLQIYSRKHVESELADLFPHLRSRGYRLELSYEDSLVGRVKMDSDSDVKEALLAFSEEESLSFRTIFITECLTPEAEVKCSKEADIMPLPKKKSKVSLYLILESDNITDCTCNISTLADSITDLSVLWRSATKMWICNIDSIDECNHL